MLYLKQKQLPQTRQLTTWPSPVFQSTDKVPVDADHPGCRGLVVRLHLPQDERPHHKVHLQPF